jgi:hypothetical protein
MTSASASTKVPEQGTGNGGGSAFLRTPSG